MEVLSQPWATGPSGEIVRVDPELWLFEAGAWDDVEAALGTRLPTDYKDLIGDGLACIFDEELLIASPFERKQGFNLIWEAARSAWSLAYVRQSAPDYFPVVVYPEPGGLLGWGNDGGGGQYHWETRGADPDQWTIAVTGRSVFDPSVERHACNLSAYLQGLASGAITAAALSGWPSPDARIERRSSD